MHKSRVGLLATVTAIMTLPAMAQDLVGDATQGEQVFRRCASCHSLEEGGRGSGPHLQGIMGRQVGGAEGFRYSRGMSDAEFVWDEAQLAAFLANPKDIVRGTRMSTRLRSDQDIADVIAYLGAAAQ